MLQSDAVDDPVAKPSWEDAAACRGLDPAIFHDDLSPDREDGGTRVDGVAWTRDDWGQAQDVCATCPVTAECLAADDGTYWDYRAGLTPLERLMDDYPDRYARHPPRRRYHLYRRLLERKRSPVISPETPGGAGR